MLLFLLACADKDSNADSAAPLLSEYILPGEDAFPESVAWDPQTRAFFTSSLGRGDVTRTLATGESSTFYAGKDDAPWVTIGLEVDVARRRLWVCASVFDGSAPGELWVLDLDSGALLSTLSLGSAREDASCTDVNLNPEGVAYVTDRANPNIYRVDWEHARVENWLEDPLLEPGFVGLNGVSFTPPGNQLLVTKYLPATLLRIPLEDPSGLIEVSLSGDDFAGDASFAGADDIVMVEDTLYATMVDRLLTLRSDDGWTSAEVSAMDLEAGGVTGLTVAEGTLYGANGQAVEYSLELDPTTPFWLRQLP